MPPSGRQKKTSERLFSRKKTEEETQEEDSLHDDLPIYQTDSLKLSPSLQTFKKEAFERLLIQIDLGAASKMPEDVLRKEVENFIAEYVEETQSQLNLREQQRISDEVVDDMIGLGPLEPLLGDPTITDIMVNSSKQIYVERRGQLERVNMTFRDNKHVLQISQRIANQVGRRVDEGSPMVDARLKDGSRVNIVIPPIAMDGASISIRRFSKASITLDDMVKQDNISPKMLSFLQLASKSRLNIIVSGGTGSGKTTLLNALSQLINPRERVITIEDSAELKLQQPHVVRLESRPPNIEGQGEVTIRNLVINALRMRPDRIVIGECRGPEAFDMLQAMNTGHDGSMSTVHANSAEESLNRLENLVLMAGYALPPEVIRNYIASAVDLVVQIGRMRDGLRRVRQVMEVIDCQDGHIRTQEIFRFVYSQDTNAEEIKGSFKTMTQSPEVRHKIAEFGLDKQLMQALKDDDV